MPTDVDDESEFPTALEEDGWDDWKDNIVNPSTVELPEVIQNEMFKAPPNFDNKYLYNLVLKDENVRFCLNIFFNELSKVDLFKIQQIVNTRKLFHSLKRSNNARIQICTHSLEEDSKQQCVVVLLIFDLCTQIVY